MRILTLLSVSALATVLTGCKAFELQKPNVSVQAKPADQIQVETQAVDAAEITTDSATPQIAARRADAPATTSVAASTPTSAVPDNCRKLKSGDYHITELVTDVFLSAGQSNAAGGNTVYNPEQYEQDKITDRVIVWTENNRWEVANPKNQTWHNGRYPSGRERNYNHPAFQIGRAISEKDECRVVAFIATAAPGMPIDHWRYDRDGHYSYISNKVTAAINALPVKYQVDMIWWMQGEADNDQIVSRYYNKLTDLISTFRSESWFPYNGYFLANETGWSTYANDAIRMLATDGNRFTDYSLGDDTLSDQFPHIESDSHKVHFNEVSLRKIGSLVANKYVDEYLTSKGI